MKKLYFYRLNQGIYSIFTIYDVVHLVCEKPVFHLTKNNTAKKNQANFHKMEGF